MDGRIFHIQKQIADQLDRPWTVAMMAATIGITSAHLQRVFRDMVGVPPATYLATLRLQKAHDILSDPACFDAIKEIRLRCGFLNESNFTRDFKKKFGVTPTDCRSLAWEKDQSNPPNE